VKTVTPLSQAPLLTTGETAVTMTYVGSQTTIPPAGPAPDGVTRRLVPFLHRVLIAVA
jgi:hypothetical protein